MFRSLVSLVAGVALGPLVPSTVDLTWHPAEKTKVEKTFAIEAELRSGDVTWTIHGQPYPPGPPLGFEMQERYGFLDEIQKIGPSRPERLARTFEAIEARHVRTIDGLGSFSENKAVEFQSNLVGKTVLFAWDEAGQAWKRSFAHDEKADPKALDTLDENVDLRAFVPQKPVAIGATWDIDPRAFDVLFAPGGDPGLRLEIGTREDLGIARRLELLFAKHPKGWARGDFRRTREEGRVECAEIHVEALLAVEGADEPEFGMKVRAEGQIKLEGEVLWDLGAHRAFSADLRGELTAHVAVDSAWSMTAPELHGSWVFDQEFDLAGTTKLLVRFQER